ncbi:ATP-dependent DNA helicase RecG [Anaerosporobacter mobilis DSM 15930]|uniref:ATP-dependent DNA helicase RecG n=1 Tax=Anaerosporobacter mobilis DSM 15930 TaxID=1120996 RepID=A0A1M7H4Z5_9FIRM|nr:ATP-dependent DNA helicase RecG [Anaerosporobacter mobilis]SHM23339.1 ATP-dependent DNA helicase RecG [Anaerosporobacter mobilis DSM 15930]
MQLTDAISVVKGIGEKTEKGLNKLGIYTVQDMLEHYPRAYDIYGRLMNINEIEEGEMAVFVGYMYMNIETKKVRHLTIASCRVKDATGSIGLTWFNMPYIKNTLKSGSYYIFRGKASRKNGMLVIEQPKILSKEEYYNKKDVLQPIYPLTNGVTNNLLSKTVKAIIEEIDLTGDFLPSTIRKENDLVEYRFAVKQIHFPKDKEEMLRARKRIVFNEFFLFTLALTYMKEEKSKKIRKNPYDRGSISDALIEGLPYELTNAQKRAWNEIMKDMCDGVIMNRLVQGDVGSGKTVLAALALAMNAENGYQGTLMVPTEVLAKQHFESLSKLYEPFDISCLLLTGSMTAKEKRLAYEKIKNKEVSVVIGTHALIQEKVEYADLGLVITDEQHRFGVKQREILSTKSENPHVLVMSATPIPRTLAIILYGDLDISVVDELPANRLPIKNCVVNTDYHSTAYRFIENQIQEGRQAYIICPMVEESESMEAENVIEYTQKVREALPPFIRTEYLHGKMKPKEKNEIMEQFAKNEIQVLVSTTVIEVGVNVPNATVMMIENAERFGLAQLHQLRGRVGRGDHQSYCILVSGSRSKETKKRLEILNTSNDGFYIAGEDLKLRGPGDLFGIRQSGDMEFKLGDIYNDAKVLKAANEAAKNMSISEIQKLCSKNERLKHQLEGYIGTTL